MFKFTTVEELKPYLKEKITGWYKNAQLDYGVTGKFLNVELIKATKKFDLDVFRITWEEDGVKFETYISNSDDYKLEDFYNIWMETEWEEVKVEIA